MFKKHPVALAKAVLAGYSVFIERLAIPLTAVAANREILATAAFLGLFP